MLLNLPIELLRKIFLKSEKLYLITITNKYIYNMKLILYLIPYKIRKDFGYENIDLLYLQKDLIYYYNNKYKNEYIRDLQNSFNSLNFYYKRYNNYRITNRFKKILGIHSYYNCDLNQKKQLRTIKIHPVYRCSYFMYKMLKKKHLNILSLIY